MAIHSVWRYTREMAIHSAALARNTVCVSVCVCAYACVCAWSWVHTHKCDAWTQLWVLLLGCCVPCFLRQALSQAWSSLPPLGWLALKMSSSLHPLCWACKRTLSQLASLYSLFLTFNSDHYFIDWAVSLVLECIFKWCESFAKNLVGILKLFLILPDLFYLSLSSLILSIG